MEKIHQFLHENSGFLELRYADNIIEKYLNEYPSKAPGYSLKYRKDFLKNMKKATPFLVLALTPTLISQEAEKLDAIEVLETARLEALQSEKNLFVHLGAPW